VIWSTEYPTEVGLYWFYGYRYGRNQGAKPEYALCEVFKISKGLMIKASGTIMFKSEVEEPHFLKAEYPEPPENFKL